MATDPNLDEQLVMLDQEGEGNEDDREARDPGRSGWSCHSIRSTSFTSIPSSFRTIPVEVMLRYQFLPLKVRRRNTACGDG